MTPKSFEPAFQDAAQIGVLPRQWFAAGKGRRGISSDTRVREQLGRAAELLSLDVDYISF